MDKPLEIIFSMFSPASIALWVVLVLIGFADYFARKKFLRGYFNFSLAWRKQNPGDGSTVKSSFEPGMIHQTHAAHFMLDEPSGTAILQPRNFKYANLFGFFVFIEFDRFSRRVTGSQYRITYGNLFMLLGAIVLFFLIDVTGPLSEVDIRSGDRIAAIVFNPYFTPLFVSSAVVINAGVSAWQFGKVAPEAMESLTEER